MSETPSGPDPYEPFRRLGAALEAAWAHADFDERAFPPLATDALRRAQLHAGFSHTGFLAHLLGHDPGCGQNDGTFGEPPIIPYRGRGFFVEVLYWLDGTTDIHRHAFSGAFQVLHGGSIHATWGWTPGTRVTSRLGFGELAFRAVEQLQAGDVRSITAGDSFIHSLFHLARPSVSVVVRTTREADHLPQLSFLPPFIAWDPLAEDRLRDRRAQALTLLFKTDEAALRAAMEAVARDGDLATLFHALRRLTQHFIEPAELAHYVALARPRYGELADRMHASLLDELRQQHIIARRANITDPHLRWILALMLNVPSRVDILRLVREGGHADPSDTILQALRSFARSHGPNTTTLLDLQVGHGAGGNERVVAIIIEVIRGLLHELPLDALTEETARALGGLSAAERGGIPKLADDLRRPASPFLNLFR